MIDGGIYNGPDGPIHGSGREISEPLRVPDTAKLLEQAARIADGASGGINDPLARAIIRAVVELARELTEGYYPITVSEDPAFMRLQARSGLGKGRQAICPKPKA